MRSVGAAVEGNMKGVGASPSGFRRDAAFGGRGGKLSGRCDAFDPWEGGCTSGPCWARVTSMQAASHKMAAAMAPYSLTSRIRKPPNNTHPHPHRRRRFAQRVPGNAFGIWGRGL